MSELKVASCYEFEKVLRGKSNKLFYPKSEVDAAIAELKAKLESVQATAYAESVDAGMENRMLKRALWLARASMCRNYDIRSYFIDCIDSKRRFAEFAMLMQKAAATAAIKAEEYK